MINPVATLGAPWLTVPTLWTGLKALLGSDMSLGRLRTFGEVCRLRSIGEAARQLNLTQPAIWLHISGLEATVGRRLFHSLPNGIEPTPTGHELTVDVGDRLDQAEAALAATSARSVELAGTLHVVGHPDFLAQVVAAEQVPLARLGVRVRL